MLVLFICWLGTALLGASSSIPSFAAAAAAAATAAAATATATGAGGRQRVQRSQHRQVGIGTVLDFHSDSTVEKHDDDIKVVHTSRVTISSS